MAMATGVAELSTAFTSLVPNRGIASWKSNGQAVKLQAPVCKRSSAVVSVNATQRQWAEEEESGKRSSLVSTAMALAGVAMVVTSVAGSAEAGVVQKVEGRDREGEDAVTTGIRERSTLSTGKGNTMMESGKGNAQASGGLMLGASKSEEQAGAYRSPQSNTYKEEEVGGKRSTPAGILQGQSNPKDKVGSGEGKIGGSALADE